MISCVEQPAAAEGNESAAAGYALGVFGQIWDLDYQFLDLFGMELVSFYNGTHHNLSN